MESIQFKTTITSLPDELISLILTYNEPREIIRFSATCKQFHEVVTINDSLWKIKYSEIMPKEMVIVVKEHKFNWLNEIIQYYKLKRKIYSELFTISPKSYWRVYEVSLEDVKIFFSFATETNLSFYYTIYILQNIVQKGNYLLDNLTISKPFYTLTVIYYSKIILCHLIHSYLAIKWVQLHIKKMLTPEIVITFFLQWIDPTNIYSDEEVENKIQSLALKVKNILREKHLKKRGTIEKYSEKQLLETLSQVIYKNEKSISFTGTKVNTLNIVKVIDERIGSIITFAVIYQAVAKRLGVNCQLIAFGDHLFLKWENHEDPDKPEFTINLDNGDIKPKGQCPFAPGAKRQYKYFPEAILHYICSSYMKLKGAITNCKTQNVFHLFNFLERRQRTRNPYKNFLSYLFEQPENYLMTALNMNYVHDVHLQTISGLSNLNEPQNIVYRRVSVKKHRSSVTYAVGMICYHKTVNYICVIRGWEVDGTQFRIPINNNLYFGVDQPFYNVMAGDQSDRFVAQENLMPVPTPFRLYQLEDQIAKEFTHFDGFSYVPNNEKMIEYPNEQQVTEIFRKRFVKVSIP